MKDAIEQYNENNGRGGLLYNEEFGLFYHPFYINWEGYPEDAKKSTVVVKTNDDVTTENEITKLLTLAKLLTSDISSTEIAKHTNMTQQAINKYRNNGSQIANMRTKNAENLISYYNNIKLEEDLKMVSGVEEARQDFNEHGSKAVIMYDTAEDAVWCDRFLTDSESTVYNTNEVIPIASKTEDVAQMGLPYAYITVESILKAVNNFKKHGSEYDPEMWGMIEWRYL